MGVTINTNVDSLKIQGCLTSSTNKLSTSMQRMSTGLKINSAKDDAAGTVIAAKMGVQLSGNQIAQNNVQNANALLSTVEGNIDVVSDNLSRIRDLTLQAKNGTYSEEEIQAMDDEVQQRIEEIDRVSGSAKYSSLQLFGEEDKSGNLTGLAKNGATFQVGANAGDDNTISADEDIFSAVTFSAVTGKGTVGDGLQKFSLVSIYKGETDAPTFDEALDKLDDGISNLTDRKSLIGSAGNRLDSALSTLTTQYENLSSSKSLITDADIASEASDYTANQILQQISTSLLAQANSAPSIATSLI